MHHSFLHFYEGFTGPWWLKPETSFVTWIWLLWFSLNSLEAIESTVSWPFPLWLTSPAGVVLAMEPFLISLVCLLPVDWGGIKGQTTLGFDVDLSGFPSSPYLCNSFVFVLVGFGGLQLFHKPQAYPRKPQGHSQEDIVPPPHHGQLGHTQRLPLADHPQRPALCIQPPHCREPHETADGSSTICTTS